MQMKSARRTLIITSLILMIVGCSSIKMGYRLLDNAIRWKINDYVSLTKPQSIALTRDINNFHRWHQTTQLSIYANFLGRKAIQFQQPTLSPADFSKIYDEAFAIAMVSLDQLGPVITDMLLSLEPEQIPGVIKNLERESAKDLKKDFARTPKQQMLKRQNNMIKRLVKFTGSLNPSQRALITEWAAALPIDKKQRVDRRERFVSTLTKQLNDRTNPQRFKNTVMAQIKTPERYSTPAYQQSYKLRKQLTLNLMSELYNSLTVGQKARLIGSVKKYQADFLSLVPK